jgi:hypothetical protein
MDDVMAVIPDLRDVPLGDLAMITLNEALGRVLPPSVVTVAPGAKFGSAI